MKKQRQERHGRHDQNEGKIIFKGNIWILRLNLLRWTNLILLTWRTLSLNPNARNEGSRERKKKKSSHAHMHNNLNKNGIQLLTKSSVEKENAEMPSKFGGHVTLKLDSYTQQTRNRLWS